MSKVLIALILMVLLSFSYESYQKPFNSFIPLNTYEFQSFEGKGESFFRYTIKELGGDIAIEIPEAEGLIGEIYIYTTYDKVLKSYDDWLNYKWKFKLDGNQLYSIKYYDTKLSYNNLYIIVKINNDAKKNIRIRVYHEYDIYSLKLDETYRLDHFLSKNIMKISIETLKGNSYEVDIRGNPENKHRIQIYEEGKRNKPKYNITDTISKLILIPENNTIYIIEIENYFYIHKATKFISYSILHNFQPLEFSKKTLEFYNNEYYYFFTDISNFEPDKEYIITIHSEKKEVNNLITSFYGKFFELNKLTIDYLAEFYPVDKDQNELKEYSFNVNNHYYKQLYFKSPEVILPSGNKLLLTYIKVNYDPLIFEPQKFNVYINQKPEIVSLKRKYNYKLIVDNDNYIPNYYTLQIPSDKNYTLFIYTNNSNNLEITHGNLLNLKGEINEEKELEKEIYILNKKEYDLEKGKYYELTLRLISNEKEPIIYIELTNNDVFLLKDKRPTGAYELIMNNCNNPFYLISQFNRYVPSKEILFSQISGMFDIRYKDNYIENDFDSILPNEYYKIEKNIIRSNKNYEILYFNCEAPGILEIYYLEENKNNIPINGQIILSMKGNVTNTFLLPKYEKHNEIETKIFIEPLINEGKIKVDLDNNTIGEISSSDNFKYDIPKYPISINPKLKFYSKEDTFIKINFLLNNKPFYEINEIGKYIELNEYNLLIKIKKNISFQNLEISMNSIENDFSYKLLKLKSTSDEKYIINPRNTPLYHLVRSNELYNKKWNYHISDPYDKLNSNYEYYIIISFDERNKMPSYNIKINYIEKIEYSDFERNIVVPQYKTMKKTMSGGEKLDYLVVIANKCGNIYPRLAINYYYDNLYQDILKSKYNLISFKNYYNKMHVELNMNKNDKFEGIELSYNYIKEKIVLDSIDMDMYNERKFMIKYDTTYKRIMWEHIIGVDHYLVYKFPHKEDLLNIITNDCYLLTQKYERTEVSSLPFNEIGEFYINVVAVFVNPISYRVVYEPMEFINKTNTMKYILFFLILVSFSLVIYIFYLKKKNELHRENNELQKENNENEYQEQKQ